MSVSKKNLLKKKCISTFVHSQTHALQFLENLLHFFLGDLKRWRMFYQMQSQKHSEWSPKCKMCLICFVTSQIYKHSHLAFFPRPSCNTVSNTASEIPLRRATEWSSEASVECIIGGYMTVQWNHGGALKKYSNLTELDLCIHKIKLFSELRCMFSNICNLANQLWGKKSHSSYWQPKYLQ